MAKHYKKLPSEIMNIDNEYLAYCFDEVAFYLEGEATDNDGRLNWDKIKWEKERSKNPNKELIGFIQKQK